ncbi:MAG TPA: sulfurtransferase [Stellaceae bacterium]|jgi:thiosulfate/3-mercaptopyruvate sulfurtransferase
MPFAHPQYLVETDWLAAHLGDPNLVVLDGTVHLIPDPKITYTVKSGREDFEKGHIPGAQFADLQEDLSDNTGTKLRFMRPSAEVFAASMGRFGVGPDSKVVLYSTANPQWASRIWWLLRTFGFDNAAVLNGGYKKWAAEGRAVETGPGKARAKSNFVVSKDRGDLMVGKDEVLAAIGDGGACTINALQANQHAGSGGNVYGRPGRIAGSVNVPTAGLIDPDAGTFLGADVLKAKFDAVGAFDKRVITYCGGGIAASATALALVMLGHPDVRLYDASMSEWAKDDSLPMEAG